MKRSLAPTQPKPVHWVGSSKADLSAFPDDVKRRVGGALWDAQIGQKAPFVKPLKGFGGGGVLEVVEIRQRLKRAGEEYELWQRSEHKPSP